MLTRMNANRVPMLTSSASVVERRRSPAIAATATPVIAVMTYGVPNLGCTLARPRGQQPVAGHREADPGLAEHQDHRHDDQADAGADGDHVAHPVDADGVEGGRERRGVLGVDVG